MASNTKNPKKGNLRHQIERSSLLTEDRKEQLLKQLPSLSPAQQKKLQEVLGVEIKILAELADRTVAEAIEKGDTKALERLDAFCTKAGKRLRKAEEGIERAGEKDQLEQHFDDINI